MSGGRPLTELTNKFSPRRKARVTARIAELKTEMVLAELRQARERSQEQLARELKVNQPAVAKLEKRADMYVSNLRRYVEALGAHLARVGARIVYAGDVAGVDVGEVEDLWDMAAVVEYPSIAAARTLLAMPEYQAIIGHRKAGLAGQLALRIKLPGH